MHRRLPLRTRIALIVLTTTALAIALGAWLAIRYFDTKLTEAAIQTSEGDVEELRVVLEEDMLASHTGSLTALVSQIARGRGVAWVGITDEHATVRVSSEGARTNATVPRPNATFPQGSPEWEKLVLWERSKDARSHAYVSKGCNVLRVIAPIENNPSCWGCHDKQAALTGMLIVDRSLEPLQKAVSVGTRRLALGGVVALAVILGCVGFVVERAILRRLDSLRQATHALGSGDLSARALDGGDDELSDVAREFDAMAARLETSVESLAAQRRQLDQLVNGIADGVLLLDLEARVVAMNRAFSARIAGEAPLPGVPYRQLLLAAGIAAESGDLPAERALVSGKLEKALLPTRGGDRYEELYAQPLLAADGHPTGVIEVWRDVTDRKVLEASVEQSERLASLGVLASSVAHEVGNPLASIVTAVDGLLARLPERSDGDSQDEIREYLEIVRKQVFRCHGATERLLGFARVPSAGDESVVDVASAAREVTTLIAPQAATQGVSVEVRTERPALALAPQGMIEQVFLNLALNALKSMPSGGTLRVEVESEALTVNVLVVDTGPGIPDDVARHLFQPFRTSRRNGRGTGLGLFISQTLIQRAGGSIEAESAPGRGATFKVRLRRADVVPPAEPTGRTEAIA